MAKALMIQGAGSNVGKSMIVAGLCRYLSNQGFTVAPFKPQNMSNNAAVTEDGGEIGRAQALQARAARRATTTDMNPVLLKPESEIGAQVIVQGQRLTTAKARDYARLKPQLLSKVLESFHRLASQVDWVIVEGAGSPAEVNLRAGDIANMGFAEAADVPVCLFGDIDRGGVIAQLVGTHVILPPEDASRITSFGINKFRGDTSLFDDGMIEIAKRTNWAPVGILPWFQEAWRLPAEDVLDISGGGDGAFKIAVPKLSRIANFDDLDPLSSEPGVTVDIISPGRPLPGDADLVLIPGSKSTISDLADFRTQGWDIDLLAHVRRGGHVLGICGGYQMLGKKIIDADGIEGPPGEVAGLELLDVVTHMIPHKRLALSNAIHLASGTRVHGYEIHIGRSDGPDCARAWLSVDGRPEGAADATGRIRGCYLHGLFAGDAFRAAFLQELGSASQLENFEDSVDRALDTLARHMETHLDLPKLLETAGNVIAR
ncbi:cobyric acid synthase [Shimia ponticola]|uniref:cobyric acid synthase n=1 Tax=Shimia ponticola TaxID=2582893 RepID=UPI0011BD4AA3|nr:cobyric acid synthase [Shimia ponticola]